MKKLAARFDNVVFQTDKILNWGAAISLAALFIAVIAGLASRVVRAPLMFTNEISGYLCLAIVYLGLPISLRIGQHIKVDFLTNRLSTQTQDILLAITNVLSFPGSIIMAIYSGTFFISSYTHRTISQTLLEFPLWIPMLLVWVGMIFFTLDLFILSVISILRLKDMIGKGGR